TTSPFTRAARADIDPVSGIDFVRIGAVGNAPWPGSGSPLDPALGRGRVDYEYHIGRFEVTTSQWVEFFNAAYRLPLNQRVPHLIPPTFWGATGSPGSWTVRAGNEMRPVGEISWRMAAIYCNWLHNGKGTTREAFMDGAYDVSTFYYLPLPTGGAADQRTHHPDARYWIPTWDEVLKAFHYDPSKANPDGTTGGWWRYSNASDTPLVYGPPGMLVNGRPTEANAGWFDEGNPQYRVLLGAYPNTQTPWGLLDAGGATSEWNERVFGSGDRLEGRGFDGSDWADSLGTATVADSLSAQGGDAPSLSTLDLGFRIASSVPSPNTIVMLGVGWGVMAARKRRR
ncbi:MAG: SUMF1/EgtB/PvdO family nonheme iron enzyme, partial [Fimbriimonadaceae bacterium]